MLMEAREAQERLDLIEEFTDRVAFKPSPWAPGVFAVGFGLAVFAAGATESIWWKMAAAVLVLGLALVLRKHIANQYLVADGGKIQLSYAVLNMWFITSMIMLEEAPLWILTPFSLAAGIHAFFAARMGKAGI